MQIIRSNLNRASFLKHNFCGAGRTITLKGQRQPTVRMHSQFKMPAEWQKHKQTITIWPDLCSVEDPDTLVAARSEVSAISNAIAKFEPVRMYTRPESMKIATNTVSENVSVVGLEVNELWVRDTGPVIVQDGKGNDKAINFNFNYWGGKLPRLGDEHASTRIASELGISCNQAPIQSEGGGIDVDGEGTLLATESSIINPNRNPGKTKSDIEEGLKQFLGVSKVIWLPGLKDHDITDYHVDAFARFVSPAVVLLSKSPKNADSAEFKAYMEARTILENATDAKGRQLKIYEVTEPDLELVPGAEDGEEPTCASYVNFLLVNEGVLIPRFGVTEADSAALEVFRHIFPARKVVQVDINALPRLGGGIHCATQQIPAA